MIVSQSVPPQTMKLIEVVKKHIINNEFHIFSGDLYDQDHILRNDQNHIMSANEIMNMDWLVDNVVGTIPKMAELDEEAKAVVEMQGFEVV